LKNVDMAHGKLGAVTGVDIDISQVSVDDYSALVFVGVHGTTIYFDERLVQGLAVEAHAKDKVVGAICIAPSILANAGLLNKRKATLFPSEKDNLLDKGADYTGDSVTVDGQIVTANGPGAALAFGREIVKLLRLISVR